MTVMKVETIEYYTGNEWEPVYTVGAFRDGDTTNYNGDNFYWKTMVWKLDDKQAHNNAHDRVLQENGGHFDDYRYQFTIMPYDPELHHLEVRDEWGRLVS